MSVKSVSSIREHAETKNQQSKLVGTWRLVSAFGTTSDGEIENPYGSHPTGLLTYTEDGHVTAMISYGSRKPLSLGMQTQEEQAEAFKTFLAYSGRYALDGDKVTHQIEISSIQNYVGKDLVRDVKFEADRITLITPPTRVNGKIQTVKLVWQRATSQRFTE